MYITQCTRGITVEKKEKKLSFYLHLSKKCHVQNYSYPYELSQCLGKSKVQYQMKKQQLSAVGLRTVMAKTKKLSEDLWLCIVAAHKERDTRPYLNIFTFQWLHYKSVIKKI